MIIQVIKKDGSRHNFATDIVKSYLENMCTGLDLGTSEIDKMITTLQRGIYDGITTKLLKKIICISVL